MKKFWIYGIAVVFVSTVLSWSNMGSSGRSGLGRGYGGGSTWSSSTGGGSWSSGGGHK